MRQWLSAAPGPSILRTRPTDRAAACAKTKKALLSAHLHIQGRKTDSDGKGLDEVTQDVFSALNYCAVQLQVPPNMNRAELQLHQANMHPQIHSVTDGQGRVIELRCAALLLSAS